MHVRNKSDEQMLSLFAHTVCLSVLSIAHHSPVIQHKGKNAVKLLRDLQLMHSNVTANTMPLYREDKCCARNWKNESDRKEEGSSLKPSIKL